MERRTRINLCQTATWQSKSQLKREFQSKQSRFEDNSDLEQAMHNFADKLKLWGASDDKQ